jgi:hypothetical protein
MSVLKNRSKGCVKVLKELLVPEMMPLPKMSSRGGGTGGGPGGPWPPPPQEIRLGGQSIFWPPRIFKEIIKIFLNFEQILWFI